MVIINGLPLVGFLRIELTNDHFNLKLPKTNLFDLQNVECV